MKIRPAQTTAEQYSKLKYPPTKSHNRDAGWDCYAQSDHTIPAHGSLTFSLGFAIVSEPFSIDRYDRNVDIFYMIQERSSQGKNGIYSAGNIIDPGYTGPVHVTLVNNTGEDVKYNEGEKVCQLVPIIKPNDDRLEIQQQLTERTDHNFGSTGKD